MRRSLLPLLAAAFVAAAIPAATSADVAASAPRPGCTSISQAADHQLTAISALRDGQLSALKSADARLQGLIAQASIQGYKIPIIITDEASLSARLGDITTSYSSLLTAVQALSANCQAAANTDAVVDLAKLRAQVVSVTQWYGDHLMPDLAATK